MGCCRKSWAGANTPNPAALRRHIKKARVPLPASRAPVNTPGPFCIAWAEKQYNLEISVPKQANTLVWRPSADGPSFDLFSAARSQGCLTDTTLNELQVKWRNLPSSVRRGLLRELAGTTFSIGHLLDRIR